MCGRVFFPDGEQLRLIPAITLTGNDFGHEFYSFVFHTSNCRQCGTFYQSTGTPSIPLKGYKAPSLVTCSEDLLFLCFLSPEEKRIFSYEAF